MKRTSILFLCTLLLPVFLWTTPLPLTLDWSHWPTLPPAPGETQSHGLAGAFMGIHENVLIVAGGANFPDGPAWEGGGKVFHDAIYLFDIQEDKWIKNKLFHLDLATAYGLSLSSSKGVICLGGQRDNEVLDHVFLLNWDQELDELIQEPLPSLPIPLANLSGDILQEVIYIAGSDPDTGEKVFARLNLNDLNAGWQALPVWPGSARTHAVGVFQNNGETDCFYLFKGRFKAANKNTTSFLSDSWSYNPVRNEWSEIPMSESSDFPLAAGAGISLGANHILLLGGDSGLVFNQIEQLNARLDSNSDQPSILVQRDSLMKHHPGFSADIWSFHTITQSWTKLGDIPNAPPVTTQVLKLENKLVLASGEIAPCIRTPDIQILELKQARQFGQLNYWILALYLLLLVGIGIRFSRKQHSTEDFFKGGQRIPAWAAGLSIFGTQLSAITFMAVPAKTFATDWLYFFLMMTIIMVSPLVIRYFLPFYRRHNLTTAYEYLELRFNRWVRWSGSIMYIFLQLGRLGIVLLLPSLALSVVTGIDVEICILSMGLLSILYTVLGGIEAVIWTDVLQVIVLLGGALLSLVILYFHLDLHTIETAITDFGKTRIFDMSWSFWEPTFWVVIIGGLATNLISYGSDQTVIQRYLTTSDEQSAAKSIRIGAWMALPSTLIFFSLGTLLFVYYQSEPALLNPSLEKTDAVFPWFIVSSLPQGISGLLIAAIFAASMSSLDSSMNSVATVLTTDFYRKFRNKETEAFYLRLAKLFTVIIGIAGTGLALVMATWGISSLWDQFNMIVGLFAGGLGGVFLLGIFNPKANAGGALLGLLLSGLLQYVIKEHTPIHLLMYAFTGLTSSFLLGSLFSLLFKPDNQDASRYTFQQLKQTKP
ncbi:MAG: sodium/solute symporter [Saprospiraceae bacterium]|nr:sodium/solute symporter [Saprospiraceae bacterium]